MLTDKALTANTFCPGNEPGLCFVERSTINPYLAGVLLLTVVILQTSVMPNFLLLGVVPDLMLLVVVAWTLLRGIREGMALALGGGLMLDLLSSGPFGAITISISASTLLTGIGEPIISRGTLWLPAAASITATIAYHLTYLVIMQLSGHLAALAPSLLQVTIPCMAVNALVMYPTYWVLRWLHQRIS